MLLNDADSASEHVRKYWHCERGLRRGGRDMQNMEERGAQRSWAAAGARARLSNWNAPGRGIALRELILLRGGRAAGLTSLTCGARSDPCGVRPSRRGSGSVAAAATQRRRLGGCVLPTAGTEERASHHGSISLVEHMGRTMAQGPFPLV